MNIKFLATEACFYATQWILKRWQVGSRPILIIGHGRSGTTWVGDIFATAKRVIYYDEPCNPGNTGKRNLINEKGLDVWFRYLRPGEADPFFERSFDRAFLGLPYGTRWHEGFFARPLPKYQVVVKEVASVMSLDWIVRRYNPKVLIMFRHPCAVSLSVQKLGVSAENEKRTLLRQPNLFCDHLGPYRSIIENTETPLEKFAAIWAARNRVLFNVSSSHPEWSTAYYEELCRNPIAEFRRLFNEFGLEWTSRAENYIISTSTRHIPGQHSTTRVSASQIDKWKKELTKSEIKSVQRIVEAFELPYYREQNDWA